MARLDTSWCVNPKVWALPWQGVALHGWSISYCDMARSDGFIPEAVVPSKRGFRVGVIALVAAGMWVPTTEPRGYRLHDYTVYNRTRAQIEAEQAADRTRKAAERNGRIPAGIRPDTRARGRPVPVP